MHLSALFEPARLRRIGRVWLLAALAAIAIHCYNQTLVGWTDGQGHPFGDDTINFWSASVLSMHGKVISVYNFLKFHEFQISEIKNDFQLYHYSYPPVLIFIMMPLGFLPYLVFWLFWLIGGWLLFALCVRRMLPNDWLLYSAAVPAVMIDFISGQIGCWIAAIFGWSLYLLPRRPTAAGLLMSLAIVKPQLVWLAPLAFLAAGQWKASLGFAVGCALLLAGTTVAFGADIWSSYAHQAKILQAVILEDGTGVWHRMISVFVLARHLGASTTMAYAAQAAASTIMAGLVARTWRVPHSQTARNSILVLGTIFASPYVSDYDLVVVGLVPLWLLASPGPQPVARNGLLGALILATLAPIVAAPLAILSGVGAGAVLLLPALVSSLRRR